MKGVISTTGREIILEKYGAVLYTQIDDRAQFRDILRLDFGSTEDASSFRYFCKRPSNYTIVDMVFPLGRTQSHISNSVDRDIMASTSELLDRLDVWSS